jgi:hypothetical protein
MRYLPGGASYQVMPSDFALVAQAKVGSVMTQAFKLGPHLMDRARQGGLEKLMFDMSQGQRSPTFGAPPEFLSREEAQEGPIATAVDEAITANPKLDTLVRGVGSGVQGAPGSTQAAIESFGQMNEYQTYIVNEWASADPMEDGFWKGVGNLSKLLISNADSMVLSSVPVAGWAMLDNMAYEENMGRVQTMFEANNWEFDPEDQEIKDIAHLFASVGTMGEVSGNLVSIGGAAGKSIIRGLMKPAGSRVFALGKTMFQQGVNAGVEGGTEAYQSWTSDMAVNKILENHAKKLGQKDFKFITPEQIAANAKGAAYIGTWVGAGMNVAGTPGAFKANLRQASADRLAKAQSPEAIRKANTIMVNNVHDTSQEITPVANMVADEKLIEAVTSMEAGDIIKMLDDLGIKDLPKNKDELIQTVMDNKSRIPEWVDEFNAQAAAALKPRKNLTTFEKFASKWRMNNEITPYQVEQAGVLYDIMAKNMGYKDISAFMDANMSLESDGVEVLEDLLTAPGWVKEGVQAIRKKAQAEGTQSTETVVEADGSERKTRVDSFMGAVLKQFNLREIFGMIKPMLKSDNMWYRAAGYWSPGSESGRSKTIDTATHEAAHGAMDISGMYPLMQWMEENGATLDKPYKGLTGQAAIDQFWMDVDSYADEHYAYGNLTDGKTFSQGERQVFNPAMANDRILQEVVTTVIQENARVSPEAREQGIEILRAFFGDDMVDIVNDPKHKAQALFTPAHKMDQQTVHNMLDRIKLILKSTGTVKLPSDKKAKYHHQIQNNYKLSDEDLNVLYGEWGDSSSLQGEARVEAIGLMDKVHNIVSQSKPPTRIYQAFFQMGRKVGEGGSQVIRGETKVTEENKFILNLFKTGDITTLAHEFAHIASGSMDTKLVQEVIKATITEYHGSYDENLHQKIETEMNDIWYKFSAFPGMAPFEPGSKKAEMLRQMQETMAEMFESYLATQTAPTPALRDMMQLFAEKYTDYYKDIRALKTQYQKINPYISSLFDAFINGEQAIPRVQDREVTLEDSETGEKKTYQLLQSRPQIKAHRIILNYLKRAEASTIELHQYLDDYTKEALKGLPLSYAKGLPTKKDITARIEKVGTNEEAMSYLADIDRLLASYQESVQGRAIKKIRDMVSGALAKPAASRGQQTGIIVQMGIKDPETRKAFEGIISMFDTKKRTEERVRKGFGLEKALTEMFKGMNNTELEDFGITREEIDFLLTMKKPALESLSNTELDLLRRALDNLIRYDARREEEFILDRKNRRDTKRETAKVDVIRSSRYQIRNDKEHQRKRGDKIHRNYMTEFLFNPSRMLENIGRRVPVIGDLMFDMIQGVRDHDAQMQQLATDFSMMTSMVPENGVSSSLGFVKPDEKVTIKLHRAKDLRNLEQKREPIRQAKGPHAPKVPDRLFDPWWNDRDRWLGEYSEKSKEDATTEVDVTLSELMMWYGYSKNEEATRRLLEGGVRFTDQTDMLYKFRSKEEFESILANLPKELMGVVDNIMNYYDTTVRGMINTTSTDLVGYAIADVDNYLPLYGENIGRDKSESETLNFLSAKGQSHARKRIAHQKFVHMRTGSRKPIYAVDFFEGIARNLDQVATYTSMALPTHEMRAILFQDAEDVDGLHAKMETMIGPKYMKQVEEWLNRIEDPRMKNDEDVARIFSKFVQRTKKGILGLSATITAIQPISVLGATLRGVSFASISKAYIQNGVEPKYTMEDLAAMHPSLWQRYMDIPSVDFGEQGGKSLARKYFMQNRSGAFQKFTEARGMKEKFAALSAIGDAGLMPMKWFDSMAISKILEAIETEGLSPEATMEKFLTAVEKTQPQTNTVLMSMMYSSKDVWVKTTIGVFQSQRDQYRGELQSTLTSYQDRWYDLQRAKRDGLGVKEAKEALYKQGVESFKHTVFITIVSSAMVSAMRNLVRGLGEPPEDMDEYWKNLGLDTFSTSAGLFPVVGDVVDMFSQGIQGNNMWSGSLLENLASVNAGRAIFLYGAAVTSYGAGNIDKANDQVYEATLKVATMAGTPLANIDKWSKKFYDWIKQRS